MKTLRLVQFLLSVLVTLPESFWLEYWVQLLFNFTPVNVRSVDRVLRPFLYKRKRIYYA